MSDKPHPGITMHKLSFGGGFMGLLFTIGSTLIFLVGLPALWYFVALAFAFGVGVAVFLRVIRPHSENRHRPLSIMASEEKPVTRAARPRQKWHRLFFAAPRVSPT